MNLSIAYIASIYYNRAIERNKATHRRTSK
nr:MAG TPA: hypothetical protein [Caudoviricetes sp.]